MNVETIYGRIEQVPIIKWKEFEPYWVPIVISLSEVITENKFHPYSANQSRLDGIVLTYKYWKTFKSEDSFPFKQAIVFLQKLKQKPLFVEAIRKFNYNYKNDWLSSSTLPLLGNRVYGFHHVLKPLFTERVDGDGVWLTIKFKISKS